MKKIFTSRSLISWLILLIAKSALVAGIKEGVLNVQEAAFLPVAAYAVTLGYTLGFSNWSTRRVWTVSILSGLCVAFLETAKLIEPLRVIIRSIPSFELEIIRWIIERKNLQISFPGTIIFETQFTEISTRTSTFFSELFSSSNREFIWDMPLLMLATWAGWKTSKHNQPLLALAPSLALQAYILQYTGKDTISLQVLIFALVLLVGINQKWNMPQEKTENTQRTIRETYSAVLVLSITLILFARFTPSISFKTITEKFTRKDNLGETLGLDKESAQTYIVSNSFGLPRQHLIGLNQKLSQTVIFTVKTSEIAATENLILNQTVPRHYWRWLTYDIYNGQGWATSPTKDNPYSANQLLLPVLSEHYQIMHQQVQKSFPQDNRLYWTGSLVTANQPFSANWRIAPESLSTNRDPLLNIDMLGAMIATQNYQADSLIPFISAKELRASEINYPNDIRARYLSLPNNIPQRVLDLAKELTVNAHNPYNKAKAIETYLRTYPYSLNITPPPPDHDIADYFLFDLKTGYCDYYATSMIVLARAIGLPARMVIGYSSGIYDPMQAEYVVREINAHSWVEIYFADIGWVEFEPTASESPLNLPDDLPQETFPSLTSFPILPEHHIYIKSGHLPQKDYAPLMIGLSSIIFICGIWFLSTQGLLRVHKSIGSIYKYVFYHGEKIYKNAPLHETPSIFADKLQSKLQTGNRWLSPARDEIRFLTKLYLQETYSAHPITKDERIYAAKIWRKLFWRLLYVRLLRL
jgi:hypothetical protein